MNKKVLLGLGSAILLTTSVFAYDMKDQGQPMSQRDISSKCSQSSKGGMHQKHKMGMKHHRDPFLSTVMRLNLSKDQRSKIKSIIQESMKSVQTPYIAFSETGFDKALFIKLSKQMRDERVQKRADVMEKVYNLLNASQKQEFSKIIKERPKMNKKGFNIPQNTPESMQE